MREHADDPRDYEMMLVVTPTVAEEGLPDVVERVSGYIAAQGGTVDSTVHENPWGRRRLAYLIDDHRDAFYVLYRFHSAAESIVEIEREIKLDEQVIRYLVVRYDEMTEHEERPPRGQAAGDGPTGGPFRRSQPAGAVAEPEADAATEPETAAEPPDSLPAQTAPIETGESPVPVEEMVATEDAGEAEPEAVDEGVDAPVEPEQPDEPEEPGEIENAEETERP
ncbi:MAG TPA: 30S ribosomal protein S6 [Thermomicrobiales bacterium]|nr:30S ribosomal protein S6 [Thermomicrobiales bacterium]